MLIRYIILNLTFCSLFGSDLKLLNIEGLSSNNVNTIFYDKNGLLWVGTDQGLNRYDGLENKVFRSNPFISTALNGNRIWFIDEYNTDTLIVISDNAMHLFTPKNYSFERFTIESRPTSHFKDKNEIWITTLDKGVYRFDSGKNLHHYKFDPLNPFSISTSEFKSRVGKKFAADNNGKIWLATSKGLCSIDKQTNFVSRYFRSNTNNKLLSDKINSVFFLDGILYIGTDNGLNYLDVDKMEFLSESKIKNISIDNFKNTNNGLLIFTKENVFKYQNKLINIYDKKISQNIATNNLTSLFWSLGEKDVNLDNKSIYVGATINDVLALNNDGYLLSTGNGVYKITSTKSSISKTNEKIELTNKIKFRNLFKSVSFNAISNVIDLNKLDSYDIINDELWFVSNGQVSKYNLTTKSISKFNYNPRDPNTFPGEASSIIFYDNFIWVGDKETGLYKYTSESLSLVKHYQFDINNPNSLQTSIVTSLIQDSENILWIGSGGDGLFSYDKNIDGFTKFDERSGLKSGIINSLFTYSNLILVYTRLGINFIAPGETLYRSLDSEDGLTVSDFKGLEFFEKRNKLFIKKGADTFKVDFNKINEMTKTSKPIINSIIGVDSRNIKYSLPFSYDKVSIPHYITSINVNVSVPSLYKAGQSLYSYRYGDGKNGSMISNNAGEMIIISKTGYSDKILELGGGEKDKIFTKVQFDYIPPWYFTWWALTIYAVLTFGGIYLFTSLRAKKLQEKMEESRRSEELEEARNLQLQLLAKKVPEMKNVEVETYIRTATEVGGDYYDFFELEDGTLIAACGDATGHGATSGMMVSITKAGLKGIEKRSPNKMLTDLNNIVKSVEIGRIRMSLNLLEFKNGHVNISSAAMPPVYHYSKKTNSVNEIELVGTPLGSFYDEEFDRYQIDFEDGDALVLMSDGLPEAPNHSGEMLDYPAVKDCIKENGSKSASGIKDSLIELSDKWLDGIQNPDDITLVIFKKNNNTGSAQA